MPFFTSPVDGAQLFYADYRPSNSASIPPLLPSAERESNLKNDVALVLLHGWPMSNRMWTRQILPLVESHGIRCIAPDCRGFGRSEWSGSNSTQPEITYNTFAADTAGILHSIEGLTDFIFVCSSMGGGESVLVHEILTADKQETGPKCKGFIWLAPSLPYPLATPENPTAPSRELWDAILTGLRTDREGFVKASIGGVFGTQAGVTMSDDDLQFFIESIRQNNAVAIERCVQIISRYDLSQNLRGLSARAGKDLNVVVVAGKDDNNWPPEAGPLKIKDLIPNADVQVWDSAAHGLYWTHAERINELILDVWRAGL